MNYKSKHDASGQLSGYLYQVLAALYLLLENKNPEAQICLEKFDDVAFVEDDIPQEMIQTKHQLYKQGNLIDTSVDLWRTLNSWCDAFKSNAGYLSDTNFLIVTTASIMDDSAALFLTNEKHRDTQKALEILLGTAETGSVQANKAYYNNFLSLSSQDQEHLVSHIYVYGNMSIIKDIKKDIMPYVTLTTLPAFENKVYDKIIGWWINNIIQCLTSLEPVYINRRQLQKVMFDIGSEYKADSLPIDVDPRYEPTDEELNELLPENRVFIEQLNLISLSNERLKRCIKDYYNAYRQRSTWVREQLLFVDELTIYESKLIDEWDRLYLLMKERLDDYGKNLDDVQKTKEGRELFNIIEASNYPIRQQVSEPFIMRGTYHQLANQLKVGWHVDFMERLCHLLRG